MPEHTIFKNVITKQLEKPKKRFANKQAEWNNHGSADIFIHAVMHDC